MKRVMYYFWIFYITSILGFVLETIWCFIRNKKIESRKGLIYEPMIPIYGMSGTLIVLIVNIFQLSSDYEIFFIGMIISTVVEFLSSFLQEKIFATKSWDYKTFPFNLNGRVNLMYSLIFGFVAVLAYNVILIPIANIFLKFDVNIYTLGLTLILCLFMFYDFFISSVAVFRMKERRQNIKRKNKFWRYIDKNYNDLRLKKVYPNMVAVKK